MENKPIEHYQKLMDEFFATNEVSYNDGAPGDWRSMPETEPPDDDVELGDVDALVSDTAKVEKIAIDAAAHEAATSPRNDLPEPTDKQKSVGNYPKGHINVGGIDIAIENPAGSKRKPEWPTLKSHYGYLKLTSGADGDHVDCFVRVGTDDSYSGSVYIIDQVKPDGTFDEHKIMLGWESRQGAIAAYRINYTPGWKVGPVTRMTWKKFKEWVAERQHTEPVSGGVL